MEPTKENIKSEVVSTLVKLVEKDTMSGYSCSPVALALSNKFKGYCQRIDYRLTSQVLDSSEDACFYNKDLKRGTNTVHPFNHPPETKYKEHILRKRFCRLSIDNLLAGVFDLVVENRTHYCKQGYNVIRVTLVLNK